MDPSSLAFIAVALLCFAIVSGRFYGTMLTAPMVFVALGFAVGPGGLNLTRLEVDHSAIHLIAEATLILVLFSDAARINLGQVRRDHALPQRMLLVGLPLAILLGAVIAYWLLPHLLVWEALLLAALLAPTDAALGQSVVSAKEVPVRIRQAINVESGLNDGIALPLVLLFASLASMASTAGDAGEWLRFGFAQITLGPIAGIAIGYAGARLLDLSSARGWMSEPYQGIAILSLAVLCYVVAEIIGGNGFIAAFIGGMVFGHTLKHPCEFLFEFMETEGQLLMLITFLIFGATLLPEGLADVRPQHVVYALLSLTIIRMLPIALSMLGAGVSITTRLFLGWFGPRGLASILFVLLILEQSQVPHAKDLLTVTVVTVGLSVLLHGLSAAPLARLYGRFTASLGECTETGDAEEIPLRSGQSND